MQVMRGCDREMRLLVVDDEQRFAETLARGLRRRGFAVDLAHDGQVALDKTVAVDYDVIVLDRDLPIVHGDDVCRELHAAGCASRVLMLTASSTVDDLVAGLSLGADDYLGKPFHFQELVARIQALGRRPARAAPTTLTVGDLVVDPQRQSATRGGLPLALTAREFGMLVELLRAEGGVVSAETLLERVWDEHADPFTSSVRVLMSRLRSKLGAPPLIETVVGAGYRIAR
jgi:DNA-binding response OmpR family regulator